LIWRRRAAGGSPVFLLDDAGQVALVGKTRTVQRFQARLASPAQQRQGAAPAQFRVATVGGDMPCERSSARLACAAEHAEQLAISADRRVVAGERMQQGRLPVRQGDGPICPCCGDQRRQRRRIARKYVLCLVPRAALSRHGTLSMATLSGSAN
jgi:hypothetical protein